MLNNRIAGASKEAISAHYDLGNDFYSLWLDKTMTYSAGLWNESDNLESAQVRKIDWHLNNLALSEKSRLLDIGCGWGSAMRRALERWSQLDVTGLTLSHEQYLYLNGQNTTKSKVIYESWENHHPTFLYDGIVSIGAFEHFVKPGISDSEKIHTYKNFFQKCSQLTNPNSYLSLQTIVYENFEVSLPNEFVKDVFPESDLPNLHQIVKASEAYYEIVSLRNDRSHYSKTLREWFKNFIVHRDKIRVNYGEEVYKKYIKYLGSFAIGFDQGTVNLVRVRMKRKK